MRTREYAENLKTRGNLEDFGVDGSIISKRNLKESVCNGAYWV
jgi:hypothetical protein